jgi:hypothetical protein
MKKVWCPKASLFNKSQSLLVEILVDNETFLTILIDNDKSKKTCFYTKLYF